MADREDNGRESKRGMKEVVGVHVSSEATYAVRMRRTQTGPEVVAIETLPAVPLPISEEGSKPKRGKSISLPSRLRTTYAALVVDPEHAYVKLLSIPGAFDEKAHARIPTQMGLKQETHMRLRLRLLAEGQGRQETRVLAVAMKEPFVKAVAQMLPSGTPAAWSIEVADLARLTPLQVQLEQSENAEPVAVVNLGGTTSSFALFMGAIPVLFRQVDVGSDAVIDSVSSSLNVDRETAEGIIADGAFDISQAARRALEPLIKQLSISRDFIERRENRRVRTVYVGGVGVAAHVIEELQNALRTDVSRWDPLAGIRVPKELAESVESDEVSLFAPAIGACLGVFAEE